MQMSIEQVFIFVEGRDLDPNIYGRICSTVCDEYGKRYEIVVADRITGTGGGKQILTQLFEFLTAQGGLLDRSQPDPKLAMFYLDKDVDDIFGALRISQHVVYTPYYCIENHLFCEGDLPSSIANAASLDPRLVETRIPDAQAWRHQAAQGWRDWTALCLAATKLVQTETVSFSRRSTINTPADAPTDPQKLATCISDMQAHTKVAQIKFNQTVAAAYRLVDTVFRQTKHDRLFKGKWYAEFAFRTAEIAAGQAPFNRNGFSDRLIGSLMATIDFRQPWVEHFRQPLRTALANL